MRKNCGFTIIELILGLTVMGIVSTVTLYVGNEIKNRANECVREAEARLFIATLLEYHEMTGAWPIAENNWVSVQTVELELRGAFEEVLWDNPYPANHENPRAFPNIWVRIDAQQLSRWGEDILRELRRRTGRNVPEAEIKNFNSIRYFFPKKNDRSWIRSEKEHIKEQNPDLGLEPVLG